jgi:hypothetical protein
MPERAGFVQVGLLVNGAEFIPQDIAERHMPFAAPPDVKVQAVYVEAEPEPCLHPYWRFVFTDGQRTVCTTCGVETTEMEEMGG